MLSYFGHEAITQARPFTQYELAQIPHTVSDRKGTTFFFLGITFYY